MTAIYHISDLHVEGGLIDKFRNGGVKRIISSLCKKISEDAEENPYVIITGDITDSGDQNEYQEALKILKPLKKVASVRITPGNHDVGGSFGTNFDKQSAKRFDKLAKTFGMECKFENKYRKKYPGYEPWVEEITGSTDGSFQIVYINTVCESKADWAVGNIGYYQAQKILEILSKKNKGHTILCMHHKPLTPGKPEFVMDLNIEDRKWMTDLVKHSEIASILYGHQSRSDKIKGNIVKRKNGTRCLLSNANDSVKNQFCYKLYSKNGKLERDKISLA